MSDQTDPPCIPITVHTFGLTGEAWGALFDRVGDAAHALDEQLFTASTGSCGHCEAPDWSDLRDMARKAGWTGRGGASWVMWGVWSGEDVADEHGWVIYHRFMKSTQVTIVGPGTGHMTNRSHAELMNPTPAEVLTAARLLGLDLGGVS